MFYAIDAYPAYQEVAYQVASGAAERTAKGFAAPDARDLYSSLRAAGARTHCVVRARQSGGIAVCDNATIISFGSGPHGDRAEPAVFQAAQGATLAPSLLRRPAVSAAEDGGAIDASQIGMTSPARRWLADLLLTFGVGFLIVSCFLFVTSRDPLPAARR